jgi:TonB family protein
MRRRPLAFFSLALTLVACAAEQPQVRPAPVPARVAKRPTVTPRAHSNDSLGMQMSIGYLDEQDVDAAMRPHVPAMVRCFDRAKEARKYLSGRVGLKFMVTASGAVEDVHVISNGLGNYAVERCLVATGKQLQLPPPEGNQSTDFEYSLTFRSTGERTVVDWPGQTLTDSLAERASDLRDCGSLGPLPVEAIAYVESDGHVGSVGLVSAGAIDPTAGACAVEQFAKLRITDTNAHAVLRAVIPMVFPEVTARADRRSFRGKRH